MNNKNEDICTSLAAEPHAPAPAIPLDLDALLSPEGAYEPGTGQEDGAQLVDLCWWAPMHGCDTLENLLDRIRLRILPHLRPPIAGIDVPGTDGEREELAALLIGDAECMEADQPDLMSATNHQLRRAAALLRQPAPAPVPVAAPTPDDFRRWWRETGSDDSGPTPEMLLTANAWAEAWAARCAQPIPQPPQGGEVEP